MEFEEFLEAEKKHVESYQSAPSFHGKLSEYISFKRHLGNWAWNKKQEYKERAEKGSTSAITSNDIYYEIALDCLGKEEIERRLTKLKGETHE